MIIIYDNEADYSDHFTWWINTGEHDPGECFDAVKHEADFRGGLQCPWLTSPLLP